MTEEFADEWGEFGFSIGPFGFGFCGPGRRIRYTRTESSHILRIRINPEVKKEQIKARLVKPGLIEIEWPRIPQGEEIPVD